MKLYKESSAEVTYYFILVLTITVVMLAGLFSFKLKKVTRIYQ